MGKKNTESKTESPKKQVDRKSHQKNQETKQEKTHKQKNKKKSKQQNKTKPAFSSVFFRFSYRRVAFFSCFYLGFGFLVCFFCLLWFCFFVKPYILCVAGLISLEHRAATTLSWFTVCPYPNFRQPLKIPKTSSDPDMATDLFARRVDRNSRKDIPGRNHLNFINSSRGVHVVFTWRSRNVHVAFTWRLAIGRPHMPLPLLRGKAVRVREVPARRSRCHMTGWWYTYNVRPPR